MVSEDSDQLGSGFLAIGRLCYLQEVSQSRLGEMSTLRHQLYALSELIEVSPLGGPQRIFSEERDDHAQQIVALADNITVHVLAMVVDTSVAEHSSDAEEVSEVG